LFSQIEKLPLVELALKAEYHSNKGLGSNPYISVIDTVSNSRYIVIFNKENKATHFELAYYQNGFSGKYDDYVSCAKAILDLLLEKYNVAYNTKMSYKIDSKESLIFTFPPKSNKAFEVFIACANKQALHALDWNRLYILVHECKKTRVAPSEIDMIHLLVARGFNEEYAEKIAEIFIHCLECLSPKYPAPF
jgi:hypothetical protein